MYSVLPAPGIRRSEDVRDSINVYHRTSTRIVRCHMRASLVAVAIPSTTKRSPRELGSEKPDITEPEKIRKVEVSRWDENEPTRSADERTHHCEQ